MNNIIDEQIDVLEQGSYTLPVLWQICHPKSRTICQLCKNSKKEECIVRAHKDAKGWIRFPKQKAKLSNAEKNFISGIGDVLKNEIEGLDKNPCTNITQKLVRYHHFHPLVRNDGEVWSYITDKNIAETVFGKEMMEKFLVSSIGRDNTSSYDKGECWFVAPTYNNQRRVVNLISPRSDAIEVSNLEYLSDDEQQDSVVLFQNEDAQESIEVISRLAIVPDTVPNLIILLDFERYRKKSLSKFYLETPMLSDGDKKAITKLLKKGYFEKAKPHEYKSTRRRELKKVARLLCKGVAKSILPNADPSESLAFIQEALAEEFNPSQHYFARVGKELFLSIDAKQKPRDRRHLLAFAAKSGISRAKSNNLLPSTNVNMHEWTCVREHALFPGPGNPIITTKYHRKKCSEATLDTFLRYLSDNGLIQDLAYGHKEFRRSNGTMITVPSVKGVMSRRDIAKLYLKFAHSICNEADHWKTPRPVVDNTDVEVNSAVVVEEYFGEEQQSETIAINELSLEEEDEEEGDFPIEEEEQDEEEDPDAD